MNRDAAYYQSLVRELIALPRETEWLELKHNKDDPTEIGEYLSALANSAALLGKAWAYVLWGIDDDSHTVLGTTFDPKGRKVGNEELESWLLRQLTPKIDFRFQTLMLDDQRIVLLEIGRAFRHPVQFSGQEYVRVGSYKKKLKDFPRRNVRFGASSMQRRSRR